MARSIKRPIIGFAGRQTAGKSLAAITLKSSGFKRMAFADPIKEALMAMGLTHEQLYGAEKELPSDILGGQTPRHAMRSLGDWGRQTYGHDFYVRIMRSKIMQMPIDQRIAIEDVRYRNEADLIHSFGGSVVLIRREGADTSPVTHSSEELDVLFDVAVSNYGTVRAFMDIIEGVVDICFDQAAE